MRTAFRTILVLIGLVLPMVNARGQEADDLPATLLRWSNNAPRSGGSPDFDEPLSSDRPDFTETSCTVGRGVTQIEMGYTYFHDSDAISQLRSHSYPEMLCRVGALADWFEIRIGWNFGSDWQSLGTLSDSQSGSEDPYLGVKLGLTLQQGLLPEMSLVPQMTIPIGGPRSVHAVLPGMNWLYGWDVSDRISTAGSSQANLAVDGETAGEYLELAQSWTVGFTLSESLGAYTEWFVIVPAGADSAHTEHYFDVGLTYRLSNNLQLDARIGKGVSATAIDCFTGAGLVIRL